MKALVGIVFFASLSAFGQVGIVAEPCANPIPGDQVLRVDFGGLCKYEMLNRKLPQASASRVVYFGDSITELWRNNIPGLRADDTINRGYSGQTTSQMVIRFRSDVVDLRPHVVHIMAGTNDIAGNTGPTSIDHIKQNIRAMVELAQAHGIKVVLGSILPSKQFSWRTNINPLPGIAAMNGWLKGYAANKGAVFVDYHSAMKAADGGLRPNLSADGTHPNAAGYAIMIPLARAAIERAAH